MQFGWRSAWALLSSVLAIHCGSDDGGGASANTGGSDGSGGDSGGSTGSGGAPGDGGSGTGGSGGGSSAFRLGMPTTLATALPFPNRLVIVGDDLYFSNRGNTNTGRVGRVPKTGGAVEFLATDQGAPAGIATDGSHLYWVNTSDGTVMRAPLGGGTPEMFAQGIQAPADLAIAQGFVFVASVSTGLLTFDSSGMGVAAVVTNARSTRVVVAGDRVLFNDTGLNDTPTGAIYATEMGSDVATLIAQNQAVPEGIAVRGPMVYWANMGVGPREMENPTLTGGGVFRMPLAGGDVEQLEDGTGEPFSVAVDERFLYFTRRAERSFGDQTLCEEAMGSLWARDLSTMESMQIAGGLVCPSTIVTDQTGVYFVTNGMDITTETGTLVRIPKEPL